MDRDAADIRSSRGPLVALVGATLTAVSPTEGAFQREFPEARAWNLIDDRLLTEASEAGGLTARLSERMARLIRYAIEGGAEGVLLTCSMFGPVAHALDTEFSTPIHAADDAAFDAATGGDYHRILLLASRQEALHSALTRLATFQSERGFSVAVQGVLAPGSLEASLKDDTAALTDALAAATLAGTAESAAQGQGKPDAVLLAQYSLAPAADHLADRVGLPVLSGPGVAARRLRDAVLTGSSSAAG